jgi:alpha-glucosidase (family GH31 glycosyl hydrolase)
MLGDDVLVAPVLEPRATSRTVVIPPGEWRAWDGTLLSGTRNVEVKVDVSTLPFFERVR